VRHLLNAGEILGVRLLTWHNLHRYSEFMEDIRDAIREGRFTAFRRALEEEYRDITREHQEAV
jgi:queuine tRNA-ribosyltransferase